MTTTAIRQRNQEIAARLAAGASLRLQEGRASISDRGRPGRVLHYRPLPACYPHAAGPHRRGRTRSNLSPSTPRTRCLARSGRPEGTYIIATGPPIGLDPDRPRDAARTGGWGASRSSPRISRPKQSSAGIVARRCVRSRASRNGSFLIHFVWRRQVRVRNPARPEQSRRAHVPIPAASPWNSPAYALAAHHGRPWQWAPSPRRFSRSRDRSAEERHDPQDHRVDESES